MQQAYEAAEDERARTGETNETVFQSMGPSGMGGDFEDDEEFEFHDDFD